MSKFWMWCKDRVLDKTAAGLLISCVLAILALFGNWATSGGLVDVLGGVKKSEFQKVGDQAVTYETFQFSNIIDAAQIPNSQGATFCALTKVDDDSGKGACMISRDQKGSWLAQTGGGGGDNSCEAICFFFGKVQ